MSQGESPRIHLWHRCAHHGQAPVVGKRYHCVDLPEGPDNDLCEAAYRLYRQGRVAFPPKDSFVAAPPGKELRFECLEGEPADQYEPWFEVPMPAVAAPSPTGPFVVRPEFCAGYQSCFGGHGFAVAHRGRPLLLTALHVMDELIRLVGVDCSVANAAYTGRELPAAVTKVNLYDLFQPRWMLAFLGEAGPMLAMADARLGEPEPNSARDLAAFRLGEAAAAKLRPVPLATQRPARGEALWLAARNDADLGKRYYKAVVVHIDDQAMAFRYEEIATGPRYSSGAPLLNREGQVVGVNVGGGRFRGSKFGHGCHLANIRRLLDASG